jgi:GT2 family glycosyltransferase
MNISIVYPVFNGLEYTKASLYSLYQIHNVENFETLVNVIIVDDGSTDGTYEWIEANYPQVKVLKGNGSLWWSGGINKAVHYAISQLNSDYILWWNNDIIAGNNYFENLFAHLHSHNPQIIIGSKIYLAQSKETVWSMGGLFDPMTGVKSLIGTAMQDCCLYNEITECDWLPGMGTITHKSVYEKVGMLDEKSFPQYHGDSDFTFRSKKMGFKIFVYPDLKIYNDTRHSGVKHDDSFRMLIRSLFSIRSNYNIKKDILFYRKHAKSYKAYWVLFLKYFKYIGGFFKWKLIGFTGRKRIHNF